MQRKILNIYRQRVEGKLQLRFVEVQTLSRPPEQTNRLSKEMFGPKTAFVYFLYDALAIFNRCSTISRQADTLFSQFRVSYRSDVIKDPAYPHPYYEYNDLVLSLPSDCHALLQLLGAVDSALHEIQDHAPSFHCKVSIHYCDHLPDYQDSQQIIQHSFDIHSSHQFKPKQPLSRYLATWMVDAVSQAPDTLSAYHKCKRRLQRILKTDDPSLAYAIRVQLFPDTKINEFIKERCDQDTVMAAMLSPDVSLRDTTALLVHSLKERIRNNTAAGVRKAISDWFGQFIRLRQHLWKSTVEEALGKKAAQNGILNHTYTEITLLLEARMYLNDNNLMVLNIRDTPTYQEHYAATKKNHDHLETELRQVCQLLGLGFLPNQNFHLNPVFNQDSSRYLMFRGFHYTERYIKALIQASCTMRLIENTQDVKQRQNFGMFPREINEKILGMTYRIDPSEVVRSISHLQYKKNR